MSYLYCRYFDVLVLTAFFVSIYDDYYQHVVFVDFDGDDDDDYDAVVDAFADYGYYHVVIHLIINLKILFNDIS